MLFYYIQVRYFRIFAYVDEIYPLLYDTCTICKKSANTYVFALNVPICTCATPSLTQRRYRQWVFFVKQSSSYISSCLRTLLCTILFYMNYRYIFRVLLRDHTGYRTFIVCHEDARVFLHTSTTELDLYAAQVLYCSQHFAQFVFQLLTISRVHSLQPYDHLSLYAIIDDYIGKPWVFVVEPPRHHELELPITLIAPVSWEEEVFYLRNTNARYTRYT